MVWPIAFAFCWNPDNAHKNGTPRILAQRLPPSTAAETSQLRNFAGQKHATILLRYNFPKFLSEMGQQNGIIACVLAPRSRIVCATRQIFFIKRCLVWVARLLCCVQLEAAMHNRQSHSLANSIRFLESKRRSIKLIPLVSVRRFEQQCY